MCNNKTIRNEKIMNILGRIPGVNFMPLIPKEWHDILLDRRLSKVKKPEIKAQTRKYEDVFSFPVGMITTTKGYSMVPYVPKIGEKMKKLAEMKKTNPQASLVDIVTSKHVRYEMKSNSVKGDKTSKDTKNKTLAINQNELEEKMVNALNSIKISEKVYGEYVNYMREELKNATTKIETQRSILNMRLGKVRQERDAFVEKYLGYIFKDEREEALYNKKRKSFDEQENNISIELDSLSVSERNKEMEFQLFAKMLKNAGTYYKKATNVQKQKICKLLVSNLVVDSRKRLRIERNPSVNILFGKNSDNLQHIQCYEQQSEQSL